MERVVCQRDIIASMLVHNYGMLARVACQISLMLTVATTRVTWGELGYIPNNIIDHDPAIICARMLLNLLNR